MAVQACVCLAFIGTVTGAAALAALVFTSLVGQQTLRNTAVSAMLLAG